jgi:protein-S-isoprenylcysteine O-methyltransferase Ste14
MPGLVRENTVRGRWLFRRRSHGPLIPLAYVLVFTGFDPLPLGGTGWLTGWRAAGLVLGLLGLVVRGWAVGKVPQGTSGRGTVKPTGVSLNTEGLYSVVRHPLYLGNLLLWMGVVVLSGNPVSIVVTPLIFWIYYEKIMMAEERFLFERFAEAFGGWAARTPALFPRLSGFVSSPLPFSLRVALARDYQALYGFVAATTAVEVVRSLGLGSRGLIHAGWVVYFATGTLAYLVLHFLKRRTSWLEVQDR